MMRTIFRTLRWLTFAVFLFGVGWTIYQVLPPQPRWVVEGGILLREFLPESQGIVLVEDNPFGATARDVVTGGVRKRVMFQGGGATFTRNGRYWLWSEGGTLLNGVETLVGADLVTGKQWRRPIARRAEPVEISEDGGIAIVTTYKHGHRIHEESGLVVHTIDMHDGQTLDSTDWEGGFGLFPTFTPQFALLPLGNHGLRIWDRNQRTAMSLPVNCQIARISSAGDALLVQNRNGDLCTLFDFPQSTRPVEFPEGAAEFSPDGKYVVHRHGTKPDGVTEKTERIDVWDVATRRLLTTVAEGGPRIKASPAGIEREYSGKARYLTSCNPAARNDASIIALPKKWLPQGWLQWHGNREPYQVTVIDARDAALYYEGKLQLLPRIKTLLISDDGRTLIVATTPSDSNTQTIECWDIPFARPWGWILGVPGGIGVSVLAWKWLRRRKAQPATT